MKITILSPETIKMGQSVTFMRSGGYKSGVVVSLLDLNKVHIHFEYPGIVSGVVNHDIALRSLLEGEIFTIK